MTLKLGDGKQCIRSDFLSLSLSFSSEWDCFKNILNVKSCRGKRPGCLLISKVTHRPKGEGRAHTQVPMCGEGPECAHARAGVTCTHPHTFLGTKVAGIRTTTAMTK